MPDFFPSSNYPGIFSTPQWIGAWKSAWSDCKNIDELNLNSDCGDCRKCFYRYRQNTLLGMRLVTLFPAGVSTAVSPSLRSEYFHFGNVSAEEFLTSACFYKWDQIYIPDLLAGSDDYTKLCSVARAKHVSVLLRDTSISYAVRLDNGTFLDYLNTRSGSVRLKLFNKRKKLYEIGDISVCNLWPNTEKFIDILNQFHMQRWGQPCYQGRNLQQITTFLHDISNDGGIPDLSVIYCDGKPISAVLDLMYCKRTYNIQSGYLEKFQDGISLGTLHFGFQLEKAFGSEAAFYDFMAGNGKKTNYKQSLATHQAVFVSVMLVRNPLVKVLYTLKDWLNSLTGKN